MVLDELILMLGGRAWTPSRVGFLGWSMGGYGALLLGARLGPARTAAICAVSPALWLSSGRRPRRVRRHRRLRGQQRVRAAGVGLDSDPHRLRGQRPVLRGDETVHRAAAQPARGRLLPGGHDAAFWSSRLPAELTWMALLLTA